MNTVDLTQEQVTVEDLLKLAAAGAVRILAADGQAFVLEEADDFDKEVALLGKSRSSAVFSTKPLQGSGHNIFGGLPAFFLTDCRVCGGPSPRKGPGDGAHLGTRRLTPLGSPG